jgi:alkanesulfonate monooxygenase SsuD/methylene tetrahydromethanopterin reductase-like flavin-dependent oxidoreductase (luciferase family)
MRFGLYASAEGPAPGAPPARVPTALPEVYASLAEDARVAEAAGFDGFFVSEHHGSPVDHLPQPLLFLAAIAGTTRRIELGATVIQLPLHHPLELAEQIAVLDNLSHGRAVAGFGLGWKEDELRAFGTSRAQAVGRFEEGFEIVRRALEDGQLSFAGEHFSLDRVRVRPRPVRRPRPPLWIGAMSERAVRRAARLADAWVSDGLHDLASTAALARLYREDSARHGRPGRVVLMRQTFVADSHAEVERVWWPHMRAIGLDYYRADYVKGGRFRGDALSRIRSEAEWTYARVAADRFLVGTPAEVVEQVRRYERECGCEYLIFHVRLGSGPDPEAARECIRRLGNEVIPAFRAPTEGSVHRGG